MALLRRTSFAVLAAAALVAGGCGGDDDKPADGTFIADVPGSDAQIGVLVEGDKATAYVCDEKGSDAAFLTGSVRDGRLKLRSADGRATLDADAGGDGTLTLDGQSKRIDAEPAEGDAGVYYASGSEGDKAVFAAWVQDEDGSQTGGRFVKLHGDFRIDGPPPPLDTSTGSVIIGDKNVKTSKAQSPGFVEQDN